MTAIATTHWAGPQVGHRSGRKHRKHKAGKVIAGVAILRAMEGRRRHGGGRGPGPFGPFGPGGFGPGFNPFGFGRGGGGRGPGRRARRGDVRGAILLLLGEEPRNGYQLMQEIEERSGGVWRPSPGSVYPALSQLEDEGLVRSDESAGRRAFELTDEGRTHVEENRESIGVPWDDVGGDLPEGLFELRKLMMQLGVATMQVAQAGNEDQTGEARKVLEDARKALYGILAGD
jgi:DNA-binding PadR family transcriptional regulator